MRAPLLPAAVCAWVVALAAVMLPGIAGILAAGAGVLAVAAVLTAGLARSAARVASVAVACAIALAVAGACAAQVALSAPGRAQAVAQAAGGRALQLEATVASKVVATPAGEVRFDADVVRLVAGDRVLAESVPVSIEIAAAEVPRAEALDLGARIVVHGAARPGDPGRRAVLRVRAVALQVRAAPEGLFAVASALRSGFVHLAGALPGPGAALLPGLAVGDTRAVPAELDTAMKSASLSHLTAVSGANCAVVVGLVFAVAALCRAPRAVRVVAALAALGGFVVLVTPEPSVVRAAAMAAIAMLGLLLGRTPAGLSTLSAAVALLLCADPWLATSLGFALSAAATGGLLVLAPPLARSMARWMPRALALALAVPLSAQLACGPLLVLIAPVVPTYGVLANLLCEPVAPLATVIGLAACLTAGVLPWLAAALAALAWVPSTWIAQVALTVSTLPAASLPWLAGLPGALALCALGGALVLLLTWRAAAARGRRILQALALVIVAATVGVQGGAALLRGPVGGSAVLPGWSIAACDIGQGDAVLVRSAERVALVDTGPDPVPLRACLDRLGIDRIDLLVLTHYDLDHVGGTSAVMGRVAVVLHGPADGAADDALLRRLERAGAQLVSATAGMSGPLGEATWRVVWPRAGERAFAPGNDSSVTVDFRGGAVPASLFLGDLSAASQAALAAAADLRPPYAVVKVAHHGSADQDPALYALLRPGVALVSVGAHNRYGHPRAPTLRLLAALGAVIARTDRSGLLAVAAAADGVRLWRERDDPPPAAPAAVGGRG